LSRAATNRLREAAAAVLRAGLEAADPARAVRRTLRTRGDGLVIAGESLQVRGRVALLAVGKAALPMADAAAALLGRRLDGGLAVTNAQGPAGRRAFEVREAGHPLPDTRGEAAARAAETFLAKLGRDDLLLLLLSGGASALLPAPAHGLRLEDKARTTSLLMRAGAGIHELNTVRKHLSRL
jgi:glycerate-2-kinase